jgi:hypothetical protein
MLKPATETKPENLGRSTPCRGSPPNPLPPSRDSFLHRRWLHFGRVAYIYSHRPKVGMLYKGDKHSILQGHVKCKVRRPSCSATDERPTDKMAVKVMLAPPGVART